MQQVDISAYFENVFNIDLGGNIACNFYDMRIHNQPTPFLDCLCEKILKRMEDVKSWKKGKDKGKK